MDRRGFQACAVHFASWETVVDSKRLSAAASLAEPVPQRERTTPSIAEPPFSSHGGWDSDIDDDWRKLAQRPRGASQEFHQLSTRRGSRHMHMIIVHPM